MLSHLHWHRGLTHGANPRRWERATFSFEVIYDILNNLAEFTVEENRVGTVYPGYEVWTFSNVDLILIAPFDPFVVSVKIFHLLTTSIA